MNFLIIGDVVGKSGVEKLQKELPNLIKKNNIDFCIVNGENSANGKGLRKQEYDKIKACGADVITMGNHVYYRKEMASEYINFKDLLIPANITNLNEPSFRGRRHSRKGPALSSGRLVTGAQGSPTRQKRYKSSYRAPPFLSDGFSIHGQETFVKPICPPGKNSEDFSKCCGAGGENIVY